MIPGEWHVWRWANKRFLRTRHLALTFIFSFRWPIFPWLLLYSLLHLSHTLNFTGHPLNRRQYQKKNIYYMAHLLTSRPFSLLMTSSNSSQSNPAPMHHNVVPSEVGWQFVPQYYTFVNKQPDRLHCFYTKTSTFIHGTEGEEGKPCYGQLVCILHIPTWNITFRVIALEVAR